MNAAKVKDAVLTYSRVVDKVSNNRLAMLGNSNKPVPFRTVRVMGGEAKAFAELVEQGLYTWTEIYAAFNGGMDLKDRNQADAKFAVKALSVDEVNAAWKWAMKNDREQFEQLSASKDEHAFDEYINDIAFAARGDE